MTADRPLAVVTGASSGIGRALAGEFASHAFDLMICAEDAGIETAAAELREVGVQVRSVRADLATYEGVEDLVVAVEATGRPVEAVAVNAGIGVGARFVDRRLEDHLRLIALNVTGAVHLTWRLLQPMVQRGRGRLLFTSSVAATMPGPYESTYNASKSFLGSFAQAIRAELAGTGVTVTALMPGPTDTDFFERAGLEDTKLGRAPKDDPRDVARDGFEAMMAGKDHVVAGSARNKLLTAAGRLLPDKATAAMHAKLSQPRLGT